MDASRTEQNIVWKDETTAHAYHRILMMQLVSIMQNRNVRIVDQRLSDAYPQFKNGEKEFYEDVLSGESRKTS